MQTTKYFHLTIVRHGETMENRNNILQGHMETLLSECGLAQAKETGLFLQNVPIDLIYCSDLKRTCQTADEIAAINDHILSRTNSPQSSIVKCSAIRERSFGVYTGMPLDAWRKEVRTQKRRSSWVPPNGESIGQVKERAEQSFGDLCNLMLEQESRSTCCPCPIIATDSDNGSSPFKCSFVTDGDTLLCRDSVETSGGEYLGHALLMSHGGFINHLLRHLASLRSVTDSHDPLQWKVIDNCSITQATVTLGQLRRSVVFHCVNSVAHLSKLSS